MEDIGFFAFPPSEPGGGPVLGCIKCNGELHFDSSVPIKISNEHRPSPYLSSDVPDPREQICSSTSQSTQEKDTNSIAILVPIAPLPEH